VQSLKPKTRRMIYILVLLSAIAFGVGVLLWNMRSHLEFFFTPSQLFEQKILENQKIRIGGLIEAESIVRDEQKISFVLTDGQKKITVVYNGLPPALFREGQGMVARGFLKGDGIFSADELLAKHDERYMPPEVARALKEQGHWRDNISMPEAESK
jgi:cytochrome c-type biogenesis protein CcmE